jgi:tetratricopeptide (TPR) repeat protein
LFGIRDARGVLSRVHGVAVLGLKVLKMMFSSRIFSRTFVLCVAGLPFGCASSYVPGPADLPRLEERIRSNPDDAETLTRVGAAYHESDRLDQAVALLERARVADPKEPNAAFFLGLVYEQQDHPTKAIHAFGDFLELAPDSRFRGQAEGRIRVLRRAELRVAVRESLKRENSLERTPSPGTVAVFPFLFAGENEELRPLGRALAEMLVTDLALTTRLTVLERVQIQALLDEVAFGESGRVDQATAARGGRLLGAGRVVQGQITAGLEVLRMDAAVVSVQADPDVASVFQEDAVARIFDMEKALALQIYDELGIALTPAERERVNERQTENLQALLAFGRGLEASDAGRYDEAQAQFAEAARLDPGFSEAGDLAADAEAVVQAETVTISQITTQVAAEVVATQVQAQVQTVTAAAATAGTRDAAQEALGTEGVAKSLPTLLTIILRRPGGGE